MTSFEVMHEVDEAILKIGDDFDTEFLSSMEKKTQSYQKIRHADFLENKFKDLYQQLEMILQLEKKFMNERASLLLTKVRDIADHMPRLASLQRMVNRAIVFARFYHTSRDLKFIQNHIERKDRKKARK